MKDIEKSTKITNLLSYIGTLCVINSKINQKLWSNMSKKLMKSEELDPAENALLDTVDYIDTKIRAYIKMIYGIKTFDKSVREQPSYDLMFRIDRYQHSISDKIKEHFFGNK
jgi:hypothetical protein